MARNTSLKRIKAEISPAKLVSINTLQDKLGVSKATILSTITLTSPKTTIYTASRSANSREDIFISAEEAQEIFSLADNSEN